MCLLQSSLASQIGEDEYTDFENEDGGRLSDRWAVELDTDDNAVADKIARSHGFRNLGKIGSLSGNYYEFATDEKATRMKRSTMTRTKRLIAHPRVQWARRQRVFERVKRGYFDTLRNKVRELEAERDKRFFSDPNFPEQWYLNNVGQSDAPLGNDIGVLDVWKRGYRGKGVVVSVLDDGLDHTHPDLKKNYDPHASWDMNNNDSDPFPNDKDPYNAHGTKCGGEIGAEADNDICGVGVAPEVNLGGIRMLDGTATDILESDALSYKPQYIDIYSNCWGPKDDGKTFGRPGKLGREALKNGATKGRGGKYCMLLFTYLSRMLLAILAYFNRNILFKKSCSLGPSFCYLFEASFT